MRIQLDRTTGNEDFCTAQIKVIMQTSYAGPTDTFVISAIKYLNEAHKEIKQQLEKMLTDES